MRPLASPQIGVAAYKSILEMVDAQKELLLKEMDPKTHMFQGRSRTDKLTPLLVYLSPAENKQIAEIYRGDLEQREFGGSEQVCYS